MLEKFIENPNHFKNILKNLILSGILILSFFYLVLIILGNVNIIYSTYFITIVQATTMAVAVFIPFIIRWTYTKTFYKEMLLIPSIISLIIFMSVIHAGFTTSFEWEKDYFEKNHKSLVNKAKFNLVQDFKKEYLEKESSKIFGNIDFIPNPTFSNLTKSIVDENNKSITRRGNVKIMSDSVVSNELYYNDYIFDKNEPIIQEYITLLETRENEIKDIIDSQEKYEFTNYFQAYFNHDKSQKLLYNQLLGTVKITENVGEISYLTGSMLKVFENNSNDGYNILKNRKKFYDDNINIFLEDTKYCAGLYELESINVLFLSEIPVCINTERNFKSGESHTFESRKKPDELYSMTDYNYGEGFTIVPKYLFNRIGSHSLYVTELTAIVGLQSWSTTYKSLFLTQMEESN